MGKADRLQGTLDLLILRALSHRAQHGFGIVEQLRNWSDDALVVEEGSLYPALHRLEREGLLAADWKRTENGRRAKYYKLTRSGRKRLDEKIGQWERLTAAVSLVVERSAS